MIKITTVTIIWILIYKINNNKEKKRIKNLRPKKEDIRRILFKEDLKILKEGYFSLKFFILSFFNIVYFTIIIILTIITIFNIGIIIIMIDIHIIVTIILHQLPAHCDIGTASSKPSVGP